MTREQTIRAISEYLFDLVRKDAEARAFIDTFAEILETHDFSDIKIQIEVKDK